MSGLPKHALLLFPSDYLRGPDLDGKEHVLTIKKIVANHRLLGSDGNEKQRPVISFEETAKMLVLNKTNSKVLTKLYGPNPRDWLNKKILIGTSKVKAFGEIHDALRVRPNIPGEGK